MDISDVSLVVFSDSSFANNEDLTSQLGYIVLLLGKNGTAHILNYSSRKKRRVTRSVLGCEVFAFADAFDSAYVLRQDLQQLLNVNIPLKMFTDSKSLFDVITKCTMTAEKRLMIDIFAINQAYDGREITNVGFVRSENNIANGFTKVMKSESLLNVMATGLCAPIVEQWVVRQEETL